MRATPLEIYLPCDVLTVKVQVGPQEHISSLERLFLEAVHESVNHFHELVDLFGIGHRPTLDLVFDLWRREYLVLDLARGAVHLDSRVEELFANNRLGELAGGESTDEIREVMLDKISGHVLPVRGLRKPPRNCMIAPAEHLDIGIQDITTADLLSALRKIVDAEERHGRRKKVLSAYLSMSQLNRTREKRWLPIYVECTSDEQADSLAVRVVDERDLPMSARVKVAEQIALIIEDLPDSLFVKRILENAVTDAPSLPDIDDVLYRLNEKTEGLVALDPSLYTQRQDQLDAIADEFEEWLIERHHAEVTAETVIGHVEHSKVVSDLIRNARRQVLLVCPWLSYDAVSRLRSIIGNALDRGVQVFLLWGIRPDDQLDQKVRNMLVELRHRYPVLFFVSQRSSRTHAKLVIQDDRKALATSLNFLSPSSPDTMEVGVLVSARDDEASCPPLEHLLYWARSAYPEFTAAQSLYLIHGDFSRATVADTSPALCPQRPVPPMVDPQSGPMNRFLLTTASRLWQRSWTEYFATARTLGTPPSTAARVLIDGQHRDILWRALRTAKKRLLIVSDQLGPEVVDGRFLRALEKRLNRGVHVALVYRRLSRHIDIVGAAPTAQLADLQSRFSGQLQYIEAQNHAKILVFDDIVVVSSFNFLSFEGYYEERRPAIRRKQRSEVGIMLSGRNTAERVINAFCGVFSDDLGGWVSHPVKVEISQVEPPPSPPSSPRMEQEFLKALSDAEDERAQAEVLTEVRQGVDDPWQLLDRLSDARLPENHLRMMAAIVLSSEWTKQQTDSASRWLHWLAQDTWRQKRFVETAVLCSAYPEIRSSEIPSESIAMLAAAWAVETPGSVLTILSHRDNLTDNEKLVVASVALVELMLRGSMEAKTALENMDEVLPPILRKLTQAVEAYWRQTYQALPVEGIRAEMNAARHREDTTNDWITLGNALDEGATANFKFVSGTRTHEYLYHENGPLGKLRSLVLEQDAGGVAEWLARETVDPLDDFLDNATRMATGRSDQNFERGKRRSYLKTLKTIVDTARKVAEPALLAVAGEDSRRMDLARPVAEMLHQEWDKLKQEVAALDLAERVVLEMLLDDINVVADWGAV